MAPTTDAKTYAWSEGRHGVCMKECAKFGSKRLAVLMHRMLLQRCLGWLGGRASHQLSLGLVSLVSLVGYIA